MLQWMGGSRRKVTASRKSTQKRQKQYFEQRRRQQQLQDSVGSTCFEGNKTSSKHAENNRSLDILSLLNLSSAEATEKSGDDSVSYQTIPYSPAVQTSKEKPPEPTEIEEPRMPSSYSNRAAFPKKRPVEVLDRHEKASNTADDKMDLLKLGTEQQLSVVDMLCDDGPTCCVDQSSECEAHVAFSIEGLGKVETVTPVHSPEAPIRTFFQSSSSPLKATRSLHSFKDINSELANLEFESDAMMQSIDAPLDRSFMKSFCSRQNMDFSKQNKKQSVLDELSLFNNYSNDLNDLLGDDELHSLSKQRSKNIWDASTDLFGDKRAEGGFDFSDKIWMDEMAASDDFLYNMNCEKDLLAFEGCKWQNNSSTMGKVCEFESTETPVQDFKNQKSESFQKLGFSDMIWDSDFGRSDDVGDLQFQPGSCFISKAAREVDSLLSEESCSSTAVSGVDKRTTNSEERRTMRCSMNIRHSESMSSEKKTSGSLRNSNALQEENLHEQEEATTISTLSNSESVPCLKTTSEMKAKPDNTCLFDAEYEPVEATRGFEFDCKMSGARKHVSSSCKHWLDDMFGTSGDLKFSEGSSFQRLGMPNLPQKSMDRRSGKLLHVQDDLVPGEEFIQGDGNKKPDTSMIDSININVPQREILHRTKSSSSRDGNSTAASESILKHSNYQETSNGTLKMRNNVGEACSPKGMEEKIPFMKTSVILHGEQEDICGKFQQEGHTSPMFQTDFGGIKDSGPGQRMTSEGRSTSSSPCQVVKKDVAKVTE